MVNPDGGVGRLTRAQLSESACLRAWKALSSDRTVQNAYIESFNGRLRDECLNEHWFMSLPLARTIV